MIWRFPTAIIAIRFPQALGATEAVHGAVTQFQQPLQIHRAQAAPRVQAVLQAQTVHRARPVLQDRGLIKIGFILRRQLWRKFPRRKTVNNFITYPKRRQAIAVFSFAVKII